ncbi:iron complex transport system substrate-binding protein [Priestia taiwanensis]|uniref:ABC transporter substrate-binding protein n=2 Tax=Priestia taiwanensis TaxID=1347902 RepID=A0A917AXE8_9BACI|nr:iron complex transport system substrate-binding protein [Priestia taiwanensis]GGE82905.1 ABC transporter substrate-binding protein [Priestia taiwanensis]
MKKLLGVFALLFVLVMSACTNGSSEKENAAESKEKKTGTITYQSENGPVEVPADPQRIVVLSTYAGNAMALSENVVGVDSWTKGSPLFQDKLKDVKEVSEENLETIIELDPDLIISLSTVKDLKKLQEIAPTVTYTYGKVDYLTQHIEIGKLLNKEKEATEWVNDFKKRAAQAGTDIKAKIGEDATVSVIENFNKELYVFGDNWGRGTEILYQEMKLKMPDKVKEMALKDGYYAVSAEVLPEYAGDYVIFSKNTDNDTSFQTTETYKNIPAVKNGRVFEANAKEFFFNDPITLDRQLEFFKKSFLGQ